MALGHAAGPTRNPVDHLEDARGRRHQQGSRVGKVQIQGYFPAITRRRVKLLAVTSGRTWRNCSPRRSTICSSSTGA